MGIVTQIRLAADAARGGKSIFSRWAAGATLACALVLSSASARGGLVELSACPTHPAAAALPHLPFNEQAFPTSFSSGEVQLLGMPTGDPLAVDPSRRGEVLSETAAIWELPAAVEMKNATAPAETVEPLLIPLPRAIWVGAWGLIVVGAFGAMKKLRRRLFA